MTHEELLAKIEKRYQIKYAGETDWQATTNGLLCFMNALRAVVELHKPVVDTFICRACYHKTDEIIFVETYPCPTIQAIEGQLK